MTNFAEISHLLTKAGACRCIADPSELAVAVGAWLADANARFEAGERGRAVVEGNRGALQAVLLLMAPYL
jgi:3-deoxy-D-manno-octulosonic-acid transferase